MFRRQFEPGEDADHLCHNHGCVNPDHVDGAHRIVNEKRMPPAEIDKRVNGEGKRWPKRRKRIKLDDIPF
jgi:hypothetical protein